ncbi:integral membrane protein [Colletotrichum incanum]|uniref:Integral membrane protein n=1 Tax=Colletotrichum incanum TaxID=1573173 RepID=A0A166R133_COLIC|nr:integral membrane protein [Colletotrichum incanum]
MHIGILLLIAATARAAANPDSDSTSPINILSATPACAGWRTAYAPMSLSKHESRNVYREPANLEIKSVSQQLCRKYPKQERRRFSKIFTVGLPALTTITVALRCVARLQATTRLWWDDWTALIALGILIVMSGLGLANSNLGFGFHYWDIEPQNGMAILKVRSHSECHFTGLFANIFYAQQMLYIFVQVFAKASICCFYSRVFTSKRFRLATKCFMVFLFTHGFMFLMLLVFQCLPIHSIWDRSVEGHCLNVAAISYGGAACSILEDIVLIIMPVPELLKLQLGKKKKSALVFMFGLGSFACVASMVRLQYLVSFADSVDPTWENVMAVIWSAVELNLAIICGSLPALRPLLKKIPVSLTTAKSTTRKGASNRRSHVQSATPNIKSQASHDFSAQSSPQNTPQKSGVARHFGSSSTAYDKDSHLTREMGFDPGSTEDFDLEELEMRRKDWAVQK